MEETKVSQNIEALDQKTNVAAKIEFSQKALSEKSAVKKRTKTKRRASTKKLEEVTPKRDRGRPRNIVT